MSVYSVFSYTLLFSFQMIFCLFSNSYFFLWNYRFVCSQPGLMNQWIKRQWLLRLQRWWRRQRQWWRQRYNITAQKNVKPIYRMQANHFLPQSDSFISLILFIAFIWWMLIGINTCQIFEFSRWKDIVSFLAQISDVLRTLFIGIIGLIDVPKLSQISVELQTNIA